MDPIQLNMRDKELDICSIFTYESRRLILRIGLVEIPGKRGIFYYLQKLIAFYCMFMYPTFIMMDIFLSDTEYTMNDVTYRASLFTSCLVSIVMNIQWIFKKETFLCTMNHIDDYLNNLKGEELERVKEIIKTENKFRKLMCGIMFTGCLFVVLSAVGSWFVSFCITKHHNFEEYVDASNVTVRIYTLDMAFPGWIPFEYRTSKLKYVIANFINVFSISNFVFTISGADSLFFSFVCFACVHFKIIIYKLSTLYDRNAKGTSTDIQDVSLINIKMEKEIRTLAIHLQAVLEFCNLIENTYNMIILINALWSISFTAFTLVVLISIPMSDPLFLPLIIYMLTGTCKIYFFCCVGDRLTETAQGVPYALFQNNWLTATASLKRSMMIITVRMMKPVHLTLGRISPISMETLLSILKAGYSFLAVFKNKKSSED